MLLRSRSSGFRERRDLTVIEATIYVERTSQKGIDDWQARAHDSTDWNRGARRVGAAAGRESPFGDSGEGIEELAQQR